MVRELFLLKALRGGLQRTAIFCNRANDLLGGSARNESVDLNRYFHIGSDDAGEERNNFIGDPNTQFPW